MVNKTQTVKRMTHVIRLPPVTDIHELLGMYRNLFMTIGIQTTIPFVSDSGFTHPIPESQDLLLKEFMETFQILNAAKTSYWAITNIAARVSSSAVTFVFDCVTAG